MKKLDKNTSNSNWNSDKYWECASIYLWILIPKFQKYYKTQFGNCLRFAIIRSKSNFLILIRNDIFHITDFTCTLCDVEYAEKNGLEMRFEKISMIDHKSSVS